MSKPARGGGVLRGFQILEYSEDVSKERKDGKGVKEIVGWDILLKQQVLLRD